MPASKQESETTNSGASPEKDAKVPRTDAFLIAAIGIVGTLLGYITAGGFAVWTNYADKTHQVEQAQKNFTQAQQREAYATFYSSVNDFVQTIWAEARKWEPSVDNLAV